MSWTLYAILAIPLGAVLLTLIDGWKLARAATAIAGLCSLGLAVAIGESNQDLIYILRWESLADRDKKFAAFQSDPERIEARRNREESGPL